MGDRLLTLLRGFSDLQLSAVAVERIVDYIGVPQEVKYAAYMHTTDSKVLG